MDHGKSGNPGPQTGTKRRPGFGTRRPESHPFCTTSSLLGEPGLRGWILDLTRQWIPKLETLNPKPWADPGNPKPKTLGRPRETLNPKPWVDPGNPKPKTLGRPRETLNPKLWVDPGGAPRRAHIVEAHANARDHIVEAHPGARKRTRPHCGRPPRKTPGPRLAVRGLKTPLCYTKSLIGRAQAPEPDSGDNTNNTNNIHNTNNTQHNTNTQH